MFLITHDLREEKHGFKMAIACQSIYDSLNPVQQNDLMIQATTFDLLNRILMLSDINEVNYGLTSDNLIKVIDFRAPSQIFALNEIVFYDSFLEVNGLVYPKNSDPSLPDQRLVPSILKKSIKNEKQKVEEGITALRLIDKNQLKQAVQESKSEILAFLSAEDDIAGCQIAKMTGIDSDYPRALELYSKVIMGNYDVVRDCLTMKLKSLSPKSFD